MRSAWIREAALFALACVVSFIVLAAFVHRSNVNVYTGRLHHMILLVDAKPYVSRVLVPQTVRLLTVPLAPYREAIVRRALALPLVWTALERFRVPRGWVLEALVLFALLQGFLVGTVYALRSLGRSLYVAPRGALDVFSALAPLLLVPFFTHGYIYDFATVFFAALLPALLAERRWSVYLAAFAVSCLNRETTVLMALLFAVHERGRLPERLWAGLLGAQLAIAAGVKLALEIVLRGNPGSPLQTHLDWHLTDASPASAAAVAGWVLSGVLLLYRLDAKPRLLRSALVLFPVLVGLYFLFGSPGEYRVFYEIMPLGWLAAFDTVAQLARVPPEIDFRGSA